MNDKYIGLIMIVFVFGVLLLLLPYAKLFYTVEKVEQRCNERWSKMVNENPIAYERYNWNSKLINMSEVGINENKSPCENC